jgi:general secretion pathway protein A
MDGFDNPSRHRQADIMYLDHFNLKTKPFALSTDPRFLWAGANQRQALATLSYGLQENRGIVVLSGDFGTGKTTLVNAFLQSLDDTVRVAQLSEPGDDPAYFRTAVAEGFGIRIENHDREGLTEGLVRLAEDRQRYRQRLLLVIDEAQGLTAEMQADLLHLACLENQGHRLLHILLVGQNEIFQWAVSATREAFLSQVSATCRLYPLNERETADYIELRLRVAGARRPLFDEGAASAIHCFSRGVPRAINLMGDYALLHAHLKEADRVDAEMVGICKDRFQIATIDDGEAPEVTVRDLTTLPAESQPPLRGRIPRGLGLAAPILLLLILAGFWRYMASNNASLNRDTAHSMKSPATEISPPFRPTSHPAPGPAIPAEASQKASTMPFIAPQSAVKQDLPSKTQHPLSETASDPQPALWQMRDTEEIQTPTVDAPAGQQPEATGAPQLMKAYSSPTETIPDLQPDAPQTGDAEPIQRRAAKQLPEPPPEEKPSVASEPKPTISALPRAAGDADSPGLVTPITATSATQTPADPGDIIDWLINEKQKGENPTPQAPDEISPSKE